LAHVVVGLGNPGPEYRDTRHNIGQRVVDHLAHQLKKAWHPDGRALVARGSWRGDTLYLVKPQSFMNVSGPAVRRVCDALGAEPEDLVLVYDDIDMELGKVRTRLKGSAGGHNGVQSVIEALGTEAIRRVKIGIGRPAHKSQVPDHVLTTFEPAEEETVAAAVATAAERVLDLLGKR
jgi:PTH1 family peptidyl-tRNA hydrolase